MKLPPRAAGSVSSAPRRTRLVCKRHSFDCRCQFARLVENIVRSRAGPSGSCGKGLRRRTERVSLRAKFLFFWRSAGANSCRAQAARLWQRGNSLFVAHLGRGTARPALERMTERGRSLVSQQPRHLRERQARLLEYRRTRLRRSSSRTSSKPVPSSANRRENVRVLIPSAFAISCLCALPCGSSLCTSFSTAARSVPFGVARSLAAASQMGRRSL